MSSHAALIAHLTQSGVLTTPRIIAAFEAVDRADFIPHADQEAAYADRPLPISRGQTISQPYTVAFMLELLEPHAGEKILDIGSGSGWTSALLGHIVGPHGAVIGLEIIPDLVEMGQENLAKYSNNVAEIRLAEETLGAPKEAPFDRILVSAGDTELPQELIGQLKVNGVLVIPIGTAIWKVTKTSDTGYETEKHEGFVFVPLVR